MLKNQIASMDDTISQLQEENTHTVFDAGHDELSEKLIGLQAQLQQEREKRISLEKDRDALQAEVTRLNAEKEKTLRMRDNLNRDVFR